jgi:hypothetical protein
MLIKIAINTVKAAVVSKNGPFILHNTIKPIILQIYIPNPSIDARFQT